MSGSQAAPASGRTRLVRAVGRWDLVALAINGIIGTSIFGLPALTVGLAGAWAPLACLVCAGIVLLIVLCFAEASSLFTGTGGPYLYAREAFGSPAGFAAGWMMWLARLTAFGANANLLISYLGYFVPGATGGTPRAAILVAAALVLTAINVRGVKQSAVLGDLLAAAKLAPMVLFVVWGFAAVEPERFRAAAEFSYGGFVQVILLHVFAFTGFEFAAIPAGEAVSPRRHLPGAMLAALALAALLYTGIQVVCIGTLPGVERSQTAMADAAARFMGPVGGAVIALAAIASTSGNLSGMYLVAPRLTYALAEGGLLPRVLAATHRAFHTPWASIVLYAALALVLALTGTFVGMVTLSVVARIGAYVLTCLAVPVLRRKLPDAPERFRLRGGATIPIMALALCGWLLWRSAWSDLAAGAAALAVGFALSPPTWRWLGRGGEA